MRIKDISWSLLLLLFVSCTTQPKIKSPIKVGVPPKNAYTGLVYLEKNEIRHYGDSCYIRSFNKGDSWDTIKVGDARLYGQRSPLSHEFVRLLSGPHETTLSARSQGGINGKWTLSVVDSVGAIMLKPAIFVNHGKRIIVGFHTFHRNGCGSYYSDDDGKTWHRSNQINTPMHKSGGIHKGIRWNHGAVEPTIVELKSGRLWMLIRTAQDELYESFSDDLGTSWQPAKPSRFYGTITMPTLHRLQDGKLLLFWCNSTPLPENNIKNTGYWEDVFTNRDAVHVAISDDDGVSWSGFRELYLNPLRNDSLMATRFGRMGSYDRSVQQCQCVELENGEILVALGQHPKFRSLVRFSPDWLYEKTRTCDFSQGLKNWSVQLYKKGIKGHCAYNRKAGARCVYDPLNEKNKVMELTAHTDSSLVMPSSGSVFNFPSALKGEVCMKLFFKRGFKGMRINLADRWFNPCDTLAYLFAPFSLKISPSLKIANIKIGPFDEWINFAFRWSIDASKGNCSFWINEKKSSISLPLSRTSLNGISYLHFCLPATTEGNKGVLIDEINYSGL